MGVTFTPNIGLAKPDDTELAANWARFSDLADDNNQIIIDKMDINVVAYTPTFIGPTTNPNVGAGSIVGEYYNIQGIIFGTFTCLLTDPGVASGTGTGAYGISLPFPVDGAFHTVGTTLNDTPGTPSVVGEAYMTDASAVATSGTTAIDVVTVAGVSYARLITETYTTKTARFFGPAIPFSLATGDAFSGNFVYKKA